MLVYRLSGEDTGASRLICQEKVSRAGVSAPFRNTSTPRNQDASVLNLYPIGTRNRQSAERKRVGYRYMAMFRAYSKVGGGSAEVVRIV